MPCTWPVRPGCENQAFRLGRLAWGIQFHIETTPELVRELGRRATRPCSRASISTCIVSRAVAVHDDLAEVWAPFAAAFVDIARDPAAVARGGRRARVDGRPR